MSSALASRITSGGISKRGSSRRTQVDNDGDLDMDNPSGGRGGRNNRRGGRGGGAGGRGGRSVNLNNAPRGPAADRRSGKGSGAGRDTRRDPAGTRPSNRRTTVADNTVPVKVEGWINSKRTVDETVKFLERKTKLKFPKYTKQGDVLVLYVKPSKVESVLEWDHVAFAQAPLRITSELGDNIVDLVVSNIKSNDVDTKVVHGLLASVLDDKFSAENKQLVLRGLDTDPKLMELTKLSTKPTAMKIFPALMVIADQKFQTIEQKREWVQWITLEGNSLTSVQPVSAVAQTFPDIITLDLGNNQIATFKGLDPWKNKFRNLRHLNLAGNPITQLPNYRDEITRRYPKLQTLDGIPVDRLAIEIGEENAPTSHVVPPTKVDALGRAILPVLTKGNCIVDEGGVGTAFLMNFFTGYDSQRAALISQLYTPESSFSLSVNTSAPRVENLSHTRQYWDDYIPVSRNLKRMRDTAGESIERLATGPEEIKAIWDKLPATRHTLDDPSLWSLDMWPTPVRPGIDGLIIMVHGEFEEANKLSGNVMKRSFDRTFTIVPVGNGEVKVANDMLVIRSYSGAEGWKVNEAAIQQQAMQQQQVPPQAVQQPVQPPAQQLPAAAAAAPQNPAVQHTPQQIAEMQEKVRMFAEKTGLTLQYAEMCVSSSNWDLAAAWEQMTVAKAQGTLTPEMFATHNPVFNPAPA